MSEPVLELWNGYPRRVFGERQAVGGTKVNRRLIQASLILALVSSVCAM